jgi:hypothetical protein
MLFLNLVCFSDIAVFFKNISDRSKLNLSVYALPELHGFEKFIPKDQNRALNVHKAYSYVYPILKSLIKDLLEMVPFFKINFYQSPREIDDHIRLLQSRIGKNIQVLERQAPGFIDPHKKAYWIDSCLPIYTIKPSTLDSVKYYNTYRFVGENIAMRHNLAANLENLTEELNEVYQKMKRLYQADELECFSF